MKLLCNCCPRQCNAERTDNDNIGGYCKMPLLPKIAKVSVHNWEEPCISGFGGSGTIFFSGCSLNCVYCQNYEISHNGFGKVVSIKRLAEIFKELENKKVQNINLVNPTHYFYAIKKALEIYRPNIPIIYNSSGYDLEENILEDIFDVYLFDLKYLNCDDALKYSNAKNYPKIAQNAILTACKLKNECVFDENKMINRGVIIRHLVLPRHTNDAIEIIKWVNENCPNAFLSIMSQYIPFNTEKFPEINRKITKREYDKVLDAILDLDLKNVFIQNNSSADEKYIPNFDLGGV